MTNPFNVNYGSSYYYGNPYMKYNNKLPGMKDCGDKSLFNFAPGPCTDSYIASYYNNVIAPSLAVLDGIDYNKSPYGGPPGNGSGTPGGSPNGGTPNGNNPGGSGSPGGGQTTVTDLSQLSVTPPEGLTIGDIEELAKLNDPSLPVDGKISYRDVEAALAALEKAKSDGTINTILGGRFKDRYGQLHDYLGAISTKMKPASGGSNSGPITSVQSLADLGLEVPDGLTVSDLEDLAHKKDPSLVKDGTLDAKEIKAAMEALEEAKSKNETPLPGKDYEQVHKFLEQAYTRMGGEDEELFKTNKDALQVISDNWSELTDLGSPSMELLAKIANGEVQASPALRKAAKYVIGNQGLAYAIGGEDGLFDVDEFNKVKDSASVDAYTKASDDMHGFKNYKEVLEEINKEGNRDLIDKADGDKDGWGNISGFKKIVDNPDKYPPRLVEAAKFMLEHPDLSTKLGGTDGKFRMWSNVAGPAWWCDKNHRDEIRALLERDEDNFAELRERTGMKLPPGVKPIEKKVNNLPGQPPAGLTIEQVQAWAHSKDKELSAKEVLTAIINLDADVRTKRVQYSQKEYEDIRNYLIHLYQNELGGTEPIPAAAQVPAQPSAAPAA